MTTNVVSVNLQQGDVSEPNLHGLVSIISPNCLSLRQVSERCESLASSFDINRVGHCHRTHPNMSVCRSRLLTTSCSTLPRRSYRSSPIFNRISHHPLNSVFLKVIVNEVQCENHSLAGYVSDLIPKINTLRSPVLTLALSMCLS